MKTLRNGTLAALLFFAFTQYATAQCGDLPCQAVHLGTLTSGGTVGNAAASIYNNHCGTKNPDEPDPTTEYAGWGNNVAVWFSFTTPATPGNRTVIRALSDPQNIGDPINIQLALYESNNGRCDGTLSYIAGRYTRESFDEELVVSCESLAPNTTYFIMLDGVVDTPEELNGVFGLQVWDVNAQEVGDYKCTATDLGTVPENGELAPTTLFSNFCATNTGDPRPRAFTQQSSVWFKFVMPTSGSVQIDATTDENGLDPIGLQLALYRSSNDLCAGVFQEVESVDQTTDKNERLTVHCLDAGRTYWIMVDGENADEQGLFNLRITDLGIRQPTRLDTTLCFGESLQVFSKTYTESGTYADTMALANGCDTIVWTTLTILEELTAEALTIEKASDEGSSDGQARVTATGGTGSYTYAWPNGQTGSTATGLRGGETYCVTITDSNGCSTEACVTVEFINNILPTVVNGSVKCNGDATGELVISVVKGTPPYTYTWQGENNNLSGTGTLNAEGETATLDNLPAGNYRIHFADVEQDTTVIGIISEPEALVIQETAHQDASCFETCDGSIEVTANGGTAPFEYTWETGNTMPALSELCAGTFAVTVTDANDCRTTFTTRIEQPAEFIATIENAKDVNCFGGADGEASVTTNGEPLTYVWSTGATAASIQNLAAGTYSVTVTNTDNCTDITSITIEEPTEPVAVEFEVVEFIRCFGESNGAIQAIPIGPGEAFTYQWSAGATQAIQRNLPTGTYSVTIENENGCLAENTIFLPQPDELSASFSTKDVRCQDANNSGRIIIEEVIGGVAPYQYSVDGIVFIDQPLLSRLLAGHYDFVVRDARGCEFSAPAIIQGPQEITVDLGEDLLLPLGRSVTIKALTNSDNPIFSWRPADSLACATCSQLEITPLRTETYVVEVLDTVSNCTASDAITIHVDKTRRVFIPNAFTPNDDGENDRLTIFADVDVRMIHQFRIFDRSGMLVYQASQMQPNDPQFGWDGRINGKVPSPGVFVYVAEIEFIDGQIQVFGGDVALLR